MWLTTVSFLLMLYVYSTYTAVQKCRNNIINPVYVNMEVRSEKTEMSDGKHVLGTRSIPSGNHTFTILWHNSPSYFLKKANISLKRCRFNNCCITTDLEQTSHADVVIFRHNYLPVTPPVKRDPNQIWVLFSMESPFYIRRSYQKKEWHNRFNWTITYGKDSDIQMTYASIVKEVKYIKKNYSEIFERKTKYVAWIVSHCSAISDRDEYVRELQKYIPVDIYGKCGNYTCSRNGTICMDGINNNYKFYLSFENSLCTDYVSEKILWMFDHKYSIIPVVRGAPNIDKFLPRKTYVNVYDFSSPEMLANHLLNIGSDEREYISYIREKDKYKPYFASYYRAMCTLCEKMNRYNISKVIDTENWFQIKKNCIIPQNVSQVYDLEIQNKLPDYWYWE